MGLRVAVIGCGAIARRQHIPALLAAGAEVTVFASRSESSARAAANEVGGGAVTTDWREAVARPDVDAVTVCTPNSLHAPVAIAAARAGKHVLVEKPFATSVADADAMINTAAEARVVLMAAHNVRFAAPFLALRAVIDDGTIGSVFSLRAAFCHSGPQQWAPGAVWFRDPDAAGGGALMDLGVHVVDTVRYLLTDEFAKVSAIVDQLPVDEDALVSFRLVSGAVGSFHAGWRSPAGPDQAVVIHGSRGSLSLDQTFGLRLARPGREPVQVPVTEPSDDPCKAFVRAATSGVAAEPTAQDGRAAVAVVAAAYTSALTGAHQAVGG